MTVSELSHPLPLLSTDDLNRLMTQEVTEQSFELLAELCDEGVITAETYEAIHAEFTEILELETA